MIELEKVKDLQIGEDLIDMRTAEHVIVRSVLLDASPGPVIICDHPHHGTVLRWPWELS